METVGSTFGCGHARTPENTVGTKTQRCKTCRHQLEAMRRRRERKSGCGIADSTLFTRHNLGPPIAPSMRDSADLAIGSQALLRALWKQHPRILNRLALKGLKVRQP